ncbi:MAG TPA: hypothetical protein VGY58_21000, partial [Gemmataceae bacterium]|nr:hypothetical protein [Gemmataceae bacterium]
RIAIPSNSDQFAANQDGALLIGQVATFASPGNPGSSPQSYALAFSVHVYVAAGSGTQTGTAGASGSTGNVPWQSITDHGSPSYQATSTSTVTVLYVTQTQESLTSLPSNVSAAGLVAITLQISSGGGQEAPPARLDQTYPAAVNVRTDPRADARAEVSSSATRPSAYGSAEHAAGAAPQTSEQAQATSSIAAAVLEVVNIRYEESTGRALGGESLPTEAPSEHELLAIVHDILASDPLLLRDKAVPTDWLERTLVGAAVGMLCAQPLVWGMAMRRRRETVQFLPISR